MPPLFQSRRAALAFLLIGQTAAMGLWFIASAVLPDMLQSVDLSPVMQALLASSVQAGFVVGALGSAALSLPDRLDPRRVFTLSGLLAAAATLALALLPPGGAVSVGLRFFTGVMLAGVYPVGMRLAVAWGVRDRGWLVGLLVGALTLGSATPYLIGFLGGADWRLALMVAAGVAALGSLPTMATALGPHHARAARLDPGALGTLWHHPGLRYATLGYLGHMWELYAFWAWLALALGTTYADALGAGPAARMGQIVTFAAVGAGAVFCLIGGRLADRVGKANVTLLFMAISGLSALATAAALGGPVWLVALAALVWGASVIPDSPQFSALIADMAPADRVGSLLSLQTALGFLLTVGTVQLAPSVAAAIGWRGTLALLALGPLFGSLAMLRLKVVTGVR
ncbi:MFS transporter [Yunchengibacter salinarum]|uniref:MFS transporter n=1 Tax=Yunchengibacter salinarum TaxID=3133399 RepID=UPI0035B58F37